MQQIDIRSTLDGSWQPSLAYVPRSSQKVPLAVGLHTWSFDRFNQVQNYLPWCRKHRWALLLPEFRGPNLRTNPNGAGACGSAHGRQDIIDAIEHLGRKYPQIDRDAVFLLGASGGGHMALLTAASFSKYFRALAVWCPVVDLASFHQFHAGRDRYAPDLEHLLGGTPQTKPESFRERSPIRFTARLKNIPLSLHHGLHDDIVPCADAKRFAAKLEAEKPQQFFYEFFDGGHEQYPLRSFDWFERIVRQNNIVKEITG